MKKPITTILLLIVLTFNSAIVFAQNLANQNDIYWQQVKNLSIGQELVVELKSGKKIKSKLQNVTDGKLSIISKNSTTEINKEEINKVYRVKKVNKATSTLIGAGAGFAIGAGTMAGIGGDDNGNAAPEFIVGVGTLGAGIGATIGFLIAAFPGKELVYEQGKDLTKK
ncbi:MAG: hypothetical protein HY819_15285 [Acidobacteria bacterium]|nr:hypothetical protein [Acidobacteriota bacterium]